MPRRPRKHSKLPRANSPKISARVAMNQGVPVEATAQPYEPMIVHNPVAYAELVEMQKVGFSIFPTRTLDEIIAPLSPLAAEPPPVHNATKREFWRARFVEWVIDAHEDDFDSLVPGQPRHTPVLPRVVYPSSEEPAAIDRDEWNSAHGLPLR